MLFFSDNYQGDVVEASNIFFQDTLMTYSNLIIFNLHNGKVRNYQ